MCGIAGIIKPNGLIDVVMLKSMGEKLAHRGPDDSGILQLQGIGLVHRRLSILGLEDSKQPMSDGDGRYHIVFNGEIYNFCTIRQMLKAKGVEFNTTGDTEVILKLYISEGIDCINYLQGMFAFAIWDSKEHTLFCARDHYGQKPFFYSFDNGAFSFASEIKALVKTGCVEPKLDLTTLYHYMGLRYCPDDTTLFERIKKLPPASYLLLKSGVIEIKRYWNIDFNQKLQGSETDIADELHEQLKSTISAHLVSDVRVGSFLSGGVDSSIVTAIASKNWPGSKFPTFSVGSDADDFSELPYARQVAEKYNTEYHESTVSPDVMKIIPKLVWHMEEPADPHAVGIYTLSSFAHKHVKVVLGGEGGDEMFAGYTRHRGQLLSNLYSTFIPSVVRKNVVGNLIHLIPESFSYYGLASKARWLNDSSFMTPAQRFYHSLAFFRFMDDQKQELFTNSALSDVTDIDTESKVTRIFNAPNAETVMDKILYSEALTRMSNHYLLIGDRMSMAFGLELRIPLVDHKLTEFVAKIPHKMKINRKRQKHIFKLAGENYLDRKFLDRTKRGFGFPMARWFRKELKKLVSNVFGESILVKQGIFDADYLNQLIKEHQDGTTDHNFRIWMLINVEVWYRLFIEDWSQDDVQAWLTELM